MIQKKARKVNDVTQVLAELFPAPIESMEEEEENLPPSHPPQVMDQDLLQLAIKHVEERVAHCVQQSLVKLEAKLISSVVDTVLKAVEQGQKPKLKANYRKVYLLLF